MVTITTVPILQNKNHFGWADRSIIFSVYGQGMFYQFKLYYQIKQFHFVLYC